MGRPKGMKDNQVKNPNPIKMNKKKSHTNLHFNVDNLTIPRKTSSFPPEFLKTSSLTSEPNPTPGSTSVQKSTHEKSWGDSDSSAHSDEFMDDSLDVHDDPSSSHQVSSPTSLSEQQQSLDSRKDWVELLIPFKPHGNSTESLTHTAPSTTLSEETPSTSSKDVEDQTMGKNWQFLSGLFDQIEGGLSTDDLLKEQKEFLESTLSSKNKKKSIPVAVRKSIEDSFDILRDRISALQEFSNKLIMFISVYGDIFRDPLEKASKGDLVDKSTQHSDHIGFPQTTGTLDSKGTNTEPIEPTFAEVLSKNRRGNFNPAHKEPPSGSTGNSCRGTKPHEQPRTKNFEPKETFLPHQRDNERTILVRGEDSFYQIKNKIDLSQANIQINTFRLTQKGEVLIKTFNKDQALKLTSTIKETFPSFSVRKPTGFAPRVEISGLDSDLSKEEIAVSLKRSNPSIFGDEDIKIVTHFKNAKSATVILETSGKVHSKITSKRKIRADWDTVWVRENFNILRCFNCLSFGHKKESCHEAKICYKCGLQDHTSQKCLVKSISCIACKRDSPAEGSNHNHSCFDPDKCPILGKKIIARKKLINYNFEPSPSPTLDVQNFHDDTEMET
jgi:hypothetical protein